MSCCSFHSNFSHISKKSPSLCKNVSGGKRVGRIVGFFFLVGWVFWFCFVWFVLCVLVCVVFVLVWFFLWKILTICGYCESWAELRASITTTAKSVLRRCSLVKLKIICGDCNLKLLPWEMPRAFTKMWICHMYCQNLTFQEPSINCICKMLVGSLLSCENSSFATTKWLACTAVCQDDSVVLSWLFFVCECLWQRWCF